ncbi:ImmA/IrrE family metallo-endopeptidase [Cohnella luojiensis]|uniref:ImmA/IrrE family metallo-endopeptidase n=1 Tax=Cohnella luojiensis TaxID=652876 RepID=A0A4Y8M6B1_9BACL|nr:ImmA/IrrE family metallo-endopeptidase [Cohnella luojiensis]TFE30804.1 ImmA/IrrE family metallo-endopeptidase [Cohnella luojiensis]
MIKGRPDYDHAEFVALTLLQQFNISELPISLETIYKSFKNLRVKTYTWFAQKNDLEIRDVCALYQSDSGVCLEMVKSKQYMILYNDTVKSAGHIRFTIAHELGHYILKHHQKIDREIIARNPVAKHQYELIEKEANCFARALLAPPHVLNALGQLDAHRVSELCHLSYPAAENVLKFFWTGLRMGRTYLNNGKIIDLFQHFIYKQKHSKSCPNCRYSFTHHEAKFCPICSYSRLIRKGATEMVYDGYDLDENGRPQTCPVCSNEELHDSGEHCKICGTYLINKCAGPTFDRFGNVDGECGTIADGNARHCIICGSETTYLQRGHLNHWKGSSRVATEDFKLPF